MIGRNTILQVRTIAGFASSVPLIAGAVGVGLVSGSRRTGVNFFTAFFPEMMLKVGGVQLEVTGSEHLTARRPAVFIFNHRNNFDVFITAALVREDWTAVGKKELENNLIAGGIGRLVDAAFIDRSDLSSAIDGLQKVEELARGGLSIIVSPEGTRVDTATVGPFKKGPFRVAMSAQVPVVPVVIRNADEIALMGSSTLRPGTVDVRVLPPISVDDWTVADLDDRIAEVRQLYVDALTSWP